MKALLLLALAGLPAVLRAEPPATRSLPLADRVSLDLLRIPAGEFIQGSPETESGRGADESIRRVRITADFFIGATAVTRGQWAAFARETGYRSEAEIGTSGGFGWDGAQVVQRKDFNWRNPGFPQDDSHPVCIVTYPDAEAFCAWVSRKTGLTVTLPTEAQWEYACRAGATNAWHNGGDEAACNAIAWHKRNSGNTTHPVASTQPNAWGLRMGGNVAEWCLDWYAPYAPLDVVVVDPLQRNSTLSDKPRRVVRGGSWAREARNTRSAARFRVDARSRNPDLGFRVVCSVEPAQPVEPATPAPPPAPVVQAEAPAIPASAPASEVEPETSHSHAPSEPVRLPEGGPEFNRLRVLAPVVVGFLVLLRLFRGSSRKSSPDGSTGERALGAGIGMLGEALSADGNSPGVELTADGFWLKRADRPGARFRYTVDRGGQTSTGDVLYIPGPRGLFVYTGFRPDQVTIETLSASDKPSSPARSRSSSRASSDSSSPTHYPSAY